MSEASSPGPARSSAAAALSGSLPSGRPDKRRREAQEEDGGADSDDGQMLNDAVYRAFDEHIQAIAAARDKKRERLAFKSAAEEPDEAAAGGAKVETEDQRDQLGEWLPGDQYQGTVNMRTLKQLLSRVDARGFERCALNHTRSLRPASPISVHFRSAQQLEFHEAFFRACGRVIYKDNWGTDKPQIMKAEGWTKCNSEVLISTPRRFGKTFSIVRRLPARSLVLVLTARGFAGHLLRLPRALAGHRDRCLLASPPRLAQAFGAHRRVFKARGRRVAHRRVQHGGLPAQRLRRAQEPHPQFSLKGRGARNRFRIRILNKHNADRYTLNALNAQPTAQSS